jgi:hypothetical protein
MMIMEYTVKQSNLQKGTVDYIGTDANMATNVAADEFGNPFDTFTTYNASSVVTGVYVSCGTAWLKY